MDLNDTEWGFLDRIQTLAVRGLFSMANETIGRVLDAYDTEESSAKRAVLEQTAYGILAEEAFYHAERFASRGDVDTATGYMGILRKYEAKGGMTKTSTEDKLRVWEVARQNGIKFQLEKANEYGSNGESFRSEQALERALGFVAECVVAQRDRVDVAKFTIDYARETASELGFSIDDRISEIEKLVQQ